MVKVTCSPGGNGSPVREAYSLNDSCVVLGQGRTKLYELIRSGAIDTIRIGRRQYIRRADLERIIAHGLPGSTSTAATEVRADRGDPIRSSARPTSSGRGRPRASVVRGRELGAGKLGGADA